MGKVRIKRIDLAEKPLPARADQGRKEIEKKSQTPKKTVRAPGLKGGERVVSAAASPEELEAMEERMKPQVPATGLRPEPDEKKGLSYKELRKHPRVVVGRSRRYQAAASLIDKNKNYPASQALEILAEIAKQRRGGQAEKETVEAHLNLKNKGFKGTVRLVAGEELKLQTEKKQPLIHVKLGPLSQGKENISQNLAHLIASVGQGQIVKLVLCTTQSPGVKVDPGSFS